MKFYKMISSINIDGNVPPGLDGRYVKNKEIFFDNGKCGQDRFYDQLYEFDYLVPHEFGDADQNSEPTAIFDYHLWHGDYPIGGWLRPISKELKDLLKSFNLGEHKFYPAFVFFKNAKHRYYVLQILRNYYQSFIDYENTEFNNLDSDRDIEDRIYQKKQFKSIQEVFNYASENWGSSINWNYERLVMKKEFREVDFITIYNLGDLVSDRVKTAIENSGLKGMEFKELPIPIEFSDEF